MRRGIRGILKEAYRSEGSLGVVRFLSAVFLRRRVNKDKTWNYKRLGLLPEGTLGREYWKHLTARRAGPRTEVQAHRHHGPTKNGAPKKTKIPTLTKSCH